MNEFRIQEEVIRQSVIAPAGAPSLGEDHDGAPASSAIRASGGQGTSLPDPGAIEPASFATRPALGINGPLAKPLRAITLRSGGRCGCTQCLADEQRDADRRDQALAQIVYQAGLDELRAAALARVPAFIDAFQEA